MSEQPKSNQPESSAIRWEEVALDVYQNSTSAPLNQLVCFLDYAVAGEEITPEQALEVIAGDRRWLLNISLEEREQALAAFDELASINQIVEKYQLCLSDSKYDFCITYGQTWFEITATLQGSLKHSTINTLNCILGAFSIDSTSSNAENSEWSGTPEQVQVWVQTAQYLFRDQLFLQSLEKALDEDRRQGEWEEE